MSEKPKRIQLSIDANGTVRAIYSDALNSLIKKGESTITRASHVEPIGNKWQVDLTPIGGPQLPALYDLREEALAVEEEWLKKNWL